MSDSLRNDLDPTVREPLDSVVMLGKSKDFFSITIAQMLTTGGYVDDEESRFSVVLLCVVKVLRSLNVVPSWFFVFFRGRGGCARIPAESYD